MKQLLKEDKIAFISLAAGIGLGLVAVVLVNLHVKRIEKKYIGGQMVEVAVASKPLKAGTRLTKNDIEYIKMPFDVKPKGVIERKAVDYVVDRILKINLDVGDPILWGAVGTTEEEGLKKFSEKIKKGYRIVTLSVDEISGLNNFIKPTDRVDIWGTFTIMDGDVAVVKTLLVLQNVTVIAVGKNTDPTVPISDYDNITLLVSPEDAELLYHAMDRGKLFFSLRNPEDNAKLELAGVDFKTFVNRIRPKVVSPSGQATTPSP